MAEVAKNKMNSRVLKGTVVATSMAKTVTVTVESKKRHPKYEKIIKRTKKYLVHDERGELKVGDLITLRETRPLSKRKRFTLHEIIERAK